MNIFYTFIPILSYLMRFFCYMFFAGCGFLILIPSVRGQQIVWEQSYGDAEMQNCESVIHTRDGGYAMIGSDGFLNYNPVKGELLLDQYWLVKTNDKGNIEWERQYGGKDEDRAHHIRQTQDGGYIIAGTSMSDSYDVSANSGSEDIWIVKLDPNGNIVWEQNFGGSDIEDPKSIRQTNNGGYIIAGQTASSDGHVSGNSKHIDGWLVRLDPNGNIVWEKNFGGTGYDAFLDVKQTNDDGFIALFRSNSSGGNLPAQYGKIDIWVIKFDGTGTMEWKQIFGGSSNDYAKSIHELDKGYIIGGATNSSDGSLSSTSSRGEYDYWFLRIDEKGNLLWQKRYGGSKGEILHALQVTNDGGYIAAGWSESSNKDVSDNHGDKDYWVVRLDEDGALLWQRSYGGPDDDLITNNGLKKAGKSCYILGGYTRAAGNDVSSHSGQRDYWLVKIRETTLPVNLVGFSGKPNESGAYLLRWKIAQKPKESGYFVLQRSKSRKDYASIRTLKMQKNETRYQAIDHNPRPGTNYYRLKWVQDGNVHFSGPESVRKRPGTAVKLYPNPSQGTTMLHFSQKNSGYVIVRNSAGLHVYKKHFTKQNKVRMDLAHLPSGVYMLHGYTGQNHWIKKVVKE